MTQECLNKLAGIYKKALTTQDFLKGMALGGGLVLGGAAADIGLTTISDKLRDRKKDAAYEAMVKIHPKLFTANQDVLRLYFDTLWNFAPDIARDPLAAGGVLTQAIALDAYGGFPADILKNIVEVQNKRNDSKVKSRGSGFSDFLSDAGKRQVMPLFKE